MRKEKPPGPGGFEYRLSVSVLKASLEFHKKAGFSARSGNVIRFNTDPKEVA